jgi:hypothetical protein
MHIPQNKVVSVKMPLLTAYIRYLTLLNIMKIHILEFIMPKGLICGERFKMNNLLRNKI